MSTGMQIALGVAIAVVLFAAGMALRRRQPGPTGRPAEPRTIDGTGMPLNEAEDVVEGRGASPEPDADLSTRARALKSAGKTIQAIKLVRAETHWGLKQAKEFVDRL